LPNPIPTENDVTRTEQSPFRLMMWHARQVAKRCVERYDGERCFNLYDFIETLAADFSAFDGLPSNDGYSYARLCWEMLKRKDKVTPNDPNRYKGMPLLG
jgi:hypothetical protein